jgi:hypothetical protein
MRSLLTALAAALLAAAPAAADYGQPWLPDWSAEPGYTSQFWGLNVTNPPDENQNAAPDIYSSNPYGTATASWDTSPYSETFHMSHVQWMAEPMGEHPAWVDAVYGGMVGSAPPDADGVYTLTASMPAVSDPGSLKVFVQYDWYEYGGQGASTVTPTITGATELKMDNYYHVELGRSGSDTPWYRTTRVFEFDSNPGAFDVDLVIDGQAPMIDSFSVTTALDAEIPQTMPVPEPASLGLLGLGVLAILRRRK